jgi:hypothetical protein
MEAKTRRTMRDRYLDAMDRVHTGQDRHLLYTLAAIALIVLLGAIIVPVTVSRTAPLPAVSDAERLATRYIEAIGKVKGVTPPADAASVVKQYGADGGTTCTSSMADLYGSAIVRPKRGRSHLDPVKLEQTRTALRVYCPKRDEQLAAYIARR